MQKSERLKLKRRRLMLRENDQLKQKNRLVKQNKPQSCKQRQSKLESRRQLLKTGSTSCKKSSRMKVRNYHLLVESCLLNQLSLRNNCQSDLQVVIGLLSITTVWLLEHKKRLPCSIPLLLTTNQPSFSIQSLESKSARSISRSLRISSNKFVLLNNGFQLFKPQQHLPTETFYRTSSHSLTPLRRI